MLAKVFKRAVLKSVTVIKFAVLDTTFAKLLTKYFRQSLAIVLKSSKFSLRKLSDNPILSRPLAVPEVNNDKVLPAKEIFVTWLVIASFCATNIMKTVAKTSSLQMTFHQSPYFLGFFRPLLWNFAKNFLLSNFHRKKVSLNVLLYNSAKVTFAGSQKIRSKAIGKVAKLAK